eukprot:NODE_1043_length_1743_cov_37.215466_g920_i0.p1 GENE.NODE_1043_length_1743_cov_37.215466_g920_i0~~NODE_1043_length_1743_cov_37.215466_g920_i0.p1  ORF type:complete len:542 (-),score=92.45 NODE_1043_length_1743_cov_37.215466_g920_i0:42-1667(-)
MDDIFLSRLIVKGECSPGQLEGLTSLGPLELACVFNSTQAGLDIESALQQLQHSSAAERTVRFLESPVRDRILGQKDEVSALRSIVQGLQAKGLQESEVADRLAGLLASAHKSQLVERAEAAVRERLHLLRSLDCRAQKHAHRAAVEAGRCDYPEPRSVPRPDESELREMAKVEFTDIILEAVEEELRSPDVVAKDNFESLAQRLHVSKTRSLLIIKGFDPALADKLRRNSGSGSGRSSEHSSASRREDSRAKENRDPRDRTKALGGAPYASPLGSPASSGSPFPRISDACSPIQLTSFHQQVTLLQEKMERKSNSHRRLEQQWKDEVQMMQLELGEAREEAEQARVAQQAAEARALELEATCALWKARCEVSAQCTESVQKDLSDLALRSVRDRQETERLAMELHCAGELQRTQSRKALSMAESLARAALEEQEWQLRGLMYRFHIASLHQLRPREWPVAWVPNELQSSCHGCSHPFSMIDRHHHCRACGNNVCRDCSRVSIPLPPFQGAVRVCKDCFDSYQRGSSKLFIISSQLAPKRV